VENYATDQGTKMRINGT